MFYPSQRISRCWWWSTKEDAREVGRRIKSTIIAGTAMPRSPTSKSSTYTPPHWPKHIRYLTSQQYHPSVEKDVLETIRGKRAPNSHQPLKLQQSFVTIRQITGPADHPASVFHACINDRTCPTQRVVSTIRAGRGTIRAICGEKNTSGGLSAGLFGGSSL